MNVAVHRIIPCVGRADYSHLCCQKRSVFILSELHNGNTNQYRALNRLYYDMKHENYTDGETVQLWALGNFYYNTLGIQWYNNLNWMTDTGVSQCVTGADWHATRKAWSSRWIW